MAKNDGSEKKVFFGEILKKIIGKEKQGRQKVKSNRRKKIKLLTLEPLQFGETVTLKTVGEPVREGYNEVPKADPNVPGIGNSRQIKGVGQGRQ